MPRGKRSSEGVPPVTLVYCDELDVRDSIPGSVRQVEAAGVESAHEQERGGTAPTVRPRQQEMGS